jgi:hypothetical protein
MQFVMGTRQGSHFLCRAHDTTMRREPITKHIRDIHQLCGLTNRAVVLRLMPDVGRCPQEFRMGVTDIESTQPFSAVLVDEVATGHPIVDRSGAHPGRKRRRHIARSCYE